MYRDVIAVIFCVLTASRTMSGSCLVATSPDELHGAITRTNRLGSAAPVSNTLNAKLIAIAESSFSPTRFRNEDFLSLDAAANSRRFRQSCLSTETTLDTYGLKESIFSLVASLNVTNPNPRIHWDAKSGFVGQGSGLIGSLAIVLPVSTSNSNEIRQGKGLATEGELKRSVVESSGFNLFIGTGEKIPGMLLDPEPAILLVLGSTLIFIAGVGRRRFVRK